MPSTHLLPESLTERVLAGLGFSTRPETSQEGLNDLYQAWCQQVPFDNVRKLVDLKLQRPAPFPGTEAGDYLEAWLKHHAGGTCWAGSNALFCLLADLGFEVERCIATMLAAPHLPPNHGSVRVRLGDAHYLVDTSILSGEPLLLAESGAGSVAHPSWGIQAQTKDGLWHVHWRPLHQPAGFECRFDRYGAEHAEYRDRHEDTRGWSPFNYQVYARINRGNEVIGMAFGSSVTLRADGSVESREIDDAERRRLLIEDFGMCEELVSQMPEDRPTPPPPGSKAAAEAEAV